MPPRAKKSAAHDKSITQHNHNNSQGLAAPGRRITKQQSGTHLNGQLHQQHQQQQQQQPDAVPKLASTPPLPSALDLLESRTRNSSRSPARPHSASTPTPPSPQQHPHAPVNGTVQPEKMGANHSHTNRGRRRSDSDGCNDPDDLEATAAGRCPPSRASSPPRIDLHAASKPPTPQPRHVVGSLTLAKTILTACPLWDVLAILIILLQLPPTIVSIIHVLFASLTFVTPASSTNLANLPSMNEILLGAGGAPSLPTIVGLDLLVFIIFVTLAYPLQNLLLDLAQAVIAISLGGAVASRGGSTKSVFCCLTLIGMSHILRWRPARQMSVNLLWTGLIKVGLQPQSTPPPVSSSAKHFPFAPGWARSILGVHIFTQGVVRMIRRYLIWRDAEQPSIPTLARSDSDVGSLPSPNSPTAATAVPPSDASADAATNSSTDGRPPGLPPANRDVKERGPSTKKKRRRATAVRSQQPFWAALASTKVTFIKELEQSQASTDSLDAQSTDLLNVGNADFRTLQNKVWIRGIGSEEISFSLCLADLSEQQGETEEEPDLTDHQQLPFYVRVNRTGWTSLKMESHERAQTQWHERPSFVWSGKITGLTAYRPYQIEFVRRDGDIILYAANLITAEPAERDSVAPLPAQTLRPSSPTTTLKISLQGLDQNLESAKGVLKRKKREHKNAITAAEKEVQNLSHKLATNSGMDERNRARILQLQQSIKRAEEEAEELREQTSNMGDIPEEEVRDSEAKRAELDSVKQQYRAVKAAHDKCKAAADAEQEKSRTELSNAQKTLQRLQQRQAKNTAKLESLMQEKARAQEAEQRRLSNRKQQMDTRMAEEARLNTHIQGFEQQIADQYVRNSALQMQSQHYQALYETARLASQNPTQNGAHSSSVPTTPEGPLPGTSGSQARNGFHFAHHSPLTNFQFPGPLADPSAAAGVPGSSSNAHRNSNPPAYQHDAFAAIRDSSRHGRRNRSSSMLSGISGYTDEQFNPSEGAPLEPAAVGVNGTSSAAFPAFQPWLVNGINGFPAPSNSTSSSFPIFQNGSFSTSGNGNGTVSATAPAFQPSTSSSSATATATATAHPRRKSSQGSGSGASSSASANSARDRDAQSGAANSPRPSAAVLRGAATAVGGNGAAGKRGSNSPRGNRGVLASPFGGRAEMATLSSAGGGAGVNGGGYGRGG